MDRKRSDPQEWIQLGPYRLTPDQVRGLLDTDGINMWMLHEAAYSVALDRDSHCRTVSLEELSPEDQERYRRSSTRQAQPETD